MTSEGDRPQQANTPVHLYNPNRVTAYALQMISRTFWQFYC